MQILFQNMILSSFESWLMGIFNLIPKFIYFLCVSFMSVIDALQLVLRKLAGLDTYYVNGVEQTGDIALSFIKGIFVENSDFPAIKNAFWSLVIFGVVLLIVATIIAIVRQEYMPSAEDLKDKPSNNKMNIIVRSIRSLFLFLVVPVSCLFGLLLSDLILMTLDGITTSTISSSLSTSINTNLLESSQLSNGVTVYMNYDIFGGRKPTSTATFSGAMFKVAAFEANRVRLDEEIFEGLHSGQVESFNLFNQSENREECAQIIDEAFANCVKLKNPAGIRVDGTLLDGIANSNFAFSIHEGEQVQYFSKYNIGLVFYYYDLWRFNFLIGFAFFIITVKILFNIVLGLMKRIVEMIALFIISPPIVAIMPLDGGKAFTDWRKNFIGKALGAYGAIIGMNVLFLILPYLNKIEFFDPSNVGLYILNLLLKGLFIIVGLSMVDGFIVLLSGLIGGDDVLKSGSETAPKVGDTLAASGKLTGAVAGIATAPFLGTGALAAKGVITGLRGANRAIIDKSTRKHANKKFAISWESGDVAKHAYENYLNDNKIYQDQMQEKYLNRSDKNRDLSKEDWLETAEGKRARDESINQQGVESFDHFKDGIDFERNKKGKIHHYNTHEDSVAGGFFEIEQQKYLKNVSAERKAKLKKVGGTVVKYTPAKNLGTTVEIFYDHLKGGLVAGGKGGFTSMIKAFQGVSAKEIEKGELIKKYQKEEQARVQAQENARKKLQGDEDTKRKLDDTQSQVEKNTAELEKQKNMQAQLQQQIHQKNKKK